MQMSRYVVRRLAAMVPSLLLVTLVAFSMIFLVPGDAASTLAGEGASQEEIQDVRERIGLDDPLPVQYVRWLGDAVRGDLGESLYGGGSVTDAITARLPVTVSLALGAMVVAVLIAVPAGTIAALRRGRWADRAATLGSTIGVALPSFWVGLVLIQILAVNTNWFPATGYVELGDGPRQWVHHLALPALTLGLAVAAETTRQLRSSMSDVLHQDYIRTAESKGLGTGKVVFKHAMKNAAMPVLTVMGFQVAYLFGGAIIVEEIFALPGLGRLTINAVFDRDLPVIQGVVVFSAVVVMATNLIVDVLYGYLNPKVRLA